MYIKKSVLVFCSVLLVIVSVVSTIYILNPFGTFADFITFTQVGKLVDEMYYEDVDGKEFVNSAIEGIAVAADDPYTNYLWGDEEKEFLENIEGNYKGIGVYIENNMEDNTITVVSAIAGSPAEEAGITTGDKLLKINGEAFTGEQLSEASSKIKGEENSEVTVTIWRKSTGITEDIVLTRREIVIPSVEGEMVMGDIGRINITQFSEGVSKLFEEKYAELREQGMEKLIIDLRNNPGGILEEVQAIADVFLEEGKLIVYTENKQKERKEYFATGSGENIPVVILTNKGSASASEVLTGALKDYNIAYHIGEQTYGKGVVQSVFGIPDYGTLSITTARYFTPNGVCIHGEGIKPDEVIEMSAEKYLKLSKLNTNEDEQFKRAIGYLNE